MNKVEMEKEYKRIFNKLLIVAIEDPSLISILGCSLHSTAVDLMGAISKKDREKLENNQKKLTSFSTEFRSVFEELSNIFQLTAKSIEEQIENKKDVLEVSHEH